MDAVSYIFLFLFLLSVFFFHSREKGMQERVQLLEAKLADRDNNTSGNAKFSELGLMSAGIAHEINNPLTIIQAKVRYLLRIFKDPRKQDELAKGLFQIQYTSERIGKTIQGIREFVYHEDKKEVDELLSMKELMDNVLVFCGQRLKNHNIELRMDKLEGVKLKGHRIQLEQAILNMINNSFDAIDHLPKKWIEISAFEVGETLEIYFKDSGKGIPEEVAKRMMDPYYTTKGGKGTGLGLALVKGIAEKHEGTFNYLPNCPNTTFLMVLPKSGPGRVPRIHKEIPVFH